MSEPAFDRLARAAAAADDRPLTRRTAVKLAALAAAAVAPLGLLPARAGGQDQPANQLPEGLCRECKDRLVPFYQRNSARCLRAFPFSGLVALSCLQQEFWLHHTRMIEEGCWGKCAGRPPNPEPVPQEPITPQPMPPAKATLA